MANPNLQLLTDAAKLLEPILGELVFVGGCATALLISDTAADVQTFSSGRLVIGGAVALEAISEAKSFLTLTDFVDTKSGFGPKPADSVQR
jgi:hypothetical protein